MLPLEYYVYDNVGGNVRTGRFGEWDRGMFPEVAQTYFWDRLPDPVVYALDLGAHIGSWSLTARSRYPGVNIVAVEPRLENHLVLRTNFYGDVGVSILNGAVGYRPGLRILACNTDNSGSNILLTDKEASAARGSSYTLEPVVSIYTLEHIFEISGFPHVDVLKIDVEGAERDILTQCSDAMLLRTRCIVGEWHSTRDAFDANLRPRLEQSGFSVEFTPHLDPAATTLGMFFALRSVWP